MGREATDKSSVGVAVSCTPAKEALRQADYCMFQLRYQPWAIQKRATAVCAQDSPTESHE